MRRIALIVLLIGMPIISYGQHRTQISYDVPSSTTISWNNDSIAPFKVVGTSIRAAQIHDLPGKSKDEIYNAAIDLISAKLVMLPDLILDKDRNSGRITAAWSEKVQLPSEYTISKSVAVDMKDGKIRITVSLNRLRLALADKIGIGSMRSSTPGEKDWYDMVISESYPLAAPRKKKANYWENSCIKILRKEMAEQLSFASEILESAESKNNDW